MSNFQTTRDKLMLDKIYDFIIILIKNCTWWNLKYTRDSMIQNSIHFLHLQKAGSELKCMRLKSGRLYNKKKIIQEFSTKLNDCQFGSTQKMKSIKQTKATVRYYDMKWIVTLISLNWALKSVVFKVLKLDRKLDKYTDFSSFLCSVN